MIPDIPDNRTQKKLKKKTKERAQKDHSIVDKEEGEEDDETLYMEKELDAVDQTLDMGENSLRLWNELDSMIFQLPTPSLKESVEKIFPSIQALQQSLHRLNTEHEALINLQTEQLHQLDAYQQQLTKQKSSESSALEEKLLMQKQSECERLKTHLGQLSREMEGLKSNLGESFFLSLNRFS